MACYDDGVLVHPAPAPGAYHDAGNADDEDEQAAGDDGEVNPPVAPDVPVVVVVAAGLVLVAEAGWADAVDVAAVLGAALDYTVVAHVVVNLSGYTAI